MQLFALNNQSPLPASLAEKRKSYQCPECHESVFVRSGPHRQPHYYHLKKSLHCRQHTKTLYHLQTQLYLFNLLPQGECVLERHFPSLHRIADVVWEPKQLVFEIQYSSISKEEIEARSNDYRSIGMEIVWILHDHRFNKKKLTLSEQTLRHQTCYYTNISGSGLGVCYDQFEVLQESCRVFKGPRLPIALEKPIFLPSDSKKLFLTHSPMRSSWKVGFEGDLLDQLQQANAATITHLEKIHQSFQTNPCNIDIKLFLKKLYKIVINMVIRSISTSGN